MSHIARLACALAASSVLLAPAHGQVRLGARSEFVVDGLSFALSPAETTSLAALRDSIADRRPVAQDAALAAARRAAASTGARYIFGLYAFEIGKQRGDRHIMAEALDMLIASGLAPRAKLAGFLGSRGAIAYQSGDYAAAGAVWQRLLDLTPDDPDALANVALVRQAEHDPKGAAGLLEKAIAVHRAAGRPVPEILYRRWLGACQQGALDKAGRAAALALVTHYPTPANWHDALSVYHQLAAPGGDAEIDLLRLTRVVGALGKAAEYQRLAQLLRLAGSPVEAKAVLDQGVSRRILDLGQSPTREIIAEVDRSLARPRVTPSAPSHAPTPSGPSPRAADALFGAGRYADAIAMYRALRADPAADVAQLDTRLGMALVAAGRDAEARATFDGAASGGEGARSTVYGELAQFWLVWLAQKDGGGVPSSLMPGGAKGGG